MGMKNKLGNVYGERVITGPVTVFWASVDKPEAPSKYSRGGDFSIKFGLPKGTNFDNLRAAVLKTAKEAFGQDVTFKDFYLPFADGDQKKSEAMHGHIVVTAKTIQKPDPRLNPKVIDADSMPFAGPVYAGSIVRVSLTPMAYESPKVDHGRGVTFKLGNVQVIKSAAYSGPDASDEFGVYQGSEETAIQDDGLPF